MQQPLRPQLVPASHVVPVATMAPTPIAMAATGSHGPSMTPMAPGMVMGSVGLVSVACRKHSKLSGIRSKNVNLTRCRAEGEADPLLAEAKAAAEAAKLQLEAAPWRQSENVGSRILFIFPCFLFGFKMLQILYYRLRLSGCDLGIYFDYV